MIEVTELYNLLNAHYGYLGWWPIFSKRETQGFNSRGYRSEFPSYPLDESDRNEVVIGAVLTQNTAWVNVEKAMALLEENSAIDAEVLLTLPEVEIATLIRPSGYYNQKAKKLKCVFTFLREQPDPQRGDLLDVWGIGQETADAILLYGYGKCEFVVDAYTVRILSRLGLVPAGSTYSDVKGFLQGHLGESIRTYQNFHAVLVEFAKNICRKKPNCSECMLKKYCSY